MDLSLHPMGRILWIFLFCLFGDFYVSGMQDTKITEVFAQWARVCPGKSSSDPLSPNIHLQILQTDLYISP